MALLFIDSFDHYATADILAKWSINITSGGSTAINTTAGRRSSGAFRCVQTTNSACGLSKTLTTSGATALVGAAVKVATTPIAILGVFEVSTGGTIQVSVRINTDMTLSVLRGAFFSGTVLGTSSATFPANTFAYLELKVVLSTTVGTVDLHLNGASILSLTGQNTAASGTTWTGVGLGHPNLGTPSANANTIDVDDLYVLDGSGAAPWNTFLGDSRVDPCYPTAAGATTGWTPSTGANWSCVDETAPNGDTDYVSAATIPLTDTYVVQDVPVAGAVLYGVQHCLSMKKTDAGTCTVAPVIRHSGTDNIGADVAPSTGYAYGLQIAQVNPGTGAAWTEAGFNAAEFGVKRTG